MTKTIKVQYFTRYTGRRYSVVPKIQMEGKWLEAIGFSVGDKLTVDYKEEKNHNPGRQRKSKCLNKSRWSSKSLPHRFLYYQSVAVCCFALVTIRSIIGLRFESIFFCESLSKSHIWSHIFILSNSLVVTTFP